jgi:predicted ribosomally synthesized peptide with SipW-like signal peptide
MKKKIILLCTAAAMVAVLAVGATLAYLTDTDEAVNTFALGNIDGTLTENPDDPEEDDPDWDNNDPTVEILPGETVTKQPKVTLQTGSSDAYVRLRVTGVDFDVNENGPEVFAAVGFDSDNWTYYKADGAEDGAYYYNNVLSLTGEGNDKTSPLFTSVKLKAWVTDNDSFGGTVVNDGNGDFLYYKNDVQVYAELIQKDFLGDPPEGTFTDLTETNPAKAAIEGFYWFDNPPQAPEPAA